MTAETKKILAQAALAGIKTTSVAREAAPTTGGKHNANSCGSPAFCGGIEI